MTITHKLTAGSARTSGIAAQAIANGASFTGSAIDNSANKDMGLSVEILYQYGTNPTASKTVKLYLLYALDGTNYEEVGWQSQIAAFSPVANTSAHRKMLVAGHQLLPYPFKLHLENTDTAQTITATVNVSTHNVESA